MRLNDYQSKSREFAIYPILHLSRVYEDIEIKYLYPVLGLVGECSELFEKFIDVDMSLYPEGRSSIIYELSDILWYTSEMAYVIGYRLSNIANFNGIDDFELTFDSWIKDHKIINDSKSISSLLMYNSGMISEYIKKSLRDNEGLIDDKTKNKLFELLHNSLVYIGNIALNINSTFNHIAVKNIEKLQSRKDRNVINGSGDLR